MRHRRDTGRNPTERTHQLHQYAGVTLASKRERQRGTPDELILSCLLTTPSRCCCNGEPLFDLIQYRHPDNFPGETIACCKTGISASSRLTLLRYCLCI